MRRGVRDGRRARGRARRRRRLGRQRRGRGRLRHRRHAPRARQRARPTRIPPASLRADRQPRVVDERRRPAQREPRQQADDPDEQPARARAPAGSADLVRPLPHDARRVPSPRPRGRGVGGGLHGARAASCRSSSTVQPGEIRARLPDAAPEEPEPFAALLRDLDEVVLPGITHWQAPGWFAYFPANASRPSILAELVAAGLGAQGMLWATSPALTEIEAHVLDWLVDLLGLPQHFKTAVGPGGGVIQMSASDSTHLVHVVARERAVARRRGDRRPGRLRLVAGALVGRARARASPGFAHVRLLDVDERLRAARRRAARRDRAATAPPGSCRRSSRAPSARPAPARSTPSPTSPTSRASTACGTTSTPRGRARRCSARSSAPHQAGAERADSYTFNPHKWLFTNFDCNVLWVADRAPLIASLSILPPYLRNAASESGEVIDYRDWHVPLGRRFRALKLWWVLRSYGARRPAPPPARAHRAGRRARAARRRAPAPRARRAGLVRARLLPPRRRQRRAPTRSRRRSTRTRTSTSRRRRSATRASSGSPIGQTRTTADDVERLWTVIADAA